MDAKQARAYLQIMGYELCEAGRKDRVEAIDAAITALEEQIRKDRLIETRTTAEEQELLAMEGICDICRWPVSGLAEDLIRQHCEQCPAIFEFKDACRLAKSEGMAQGVDMVMTALKKVFGKEKTDGSD